MTIIFECDSTRPIRYFEGTEIVDTRGGMLTGFLKAGMDSVYIIKRDRNLTETIPEVKKSAPEKNKPYYRRGRW